jgi:hypothetical protein
MIRAGSHGNIKVGGVKAARCTGWTFNASRELLDGTPIYQWSERVRPGHTTADCDATFICDPTSSVGATLLASLRANEPAALNVTLLNDTDNGYSFNAHITQHVTTVATKNATRIKVRLQVTGPVTEL